MLQCLWLPSGSCGAVGAAWCCGQAHTLLAQMAPFPLFALLCSAEATYAYSGAALYTR